MITAKEESVVFAGIKQNTLKGKSCILPISLPLHPYTESWLGKSEGEWESRLQCILSFVVKSQLKSFHIVLADVLQRFTIMSVRNCTEEEARKEVLDKSAPFFELLKKWTTKYLSPMGIAYEIVTWQDYSDETIKKHLQAVNNEYNNNLVFRNGIHSTALNFIKTSRLDISPNNISLVMINNINHIKEELAMLLDWKYDYLIYPSNPTTAITKAHEAFSNSYKDIPRYLPFAIRSKSKMSVTDLLSTYEHMLTLLPGNIYCKDNDGCYIWCNNQFARLLKLSDSSQVVGKNDYNFLEEKLASEITRNDLRIIRDRKLEMEEEMGINEQGRPTPYLTIKTPIYNKSNNVIGLLGVSVDITDRKRVEQLQQEKAVIEKVSKAVEAISGTIAHEMRTPMSIVGINADNLITAIKVLACDENKKADIQNMLKNIKFAVKHGSHVVNMLLTKLHRVFCREDIIDPTEFPVVSIKDCIDAAVREYPFYINDHNSIAWDNTIHKDFYFRGDHTTMKQVLNNLIIT